jgi:hypothetical protein
MRGRDAPRLEGDYGSPSQGMDSAEGPELPVWTSPLLLVGRGLGWGWGVVRFAALTEFWKMDLGAFTGRGQGGPCLTDAAHRPLPMLPSQTCRYAATRTMPQRSSRLE